MAAVKRLLAAGETLASIEEKYRILPVDVKTFVEDDYYLGSKGILYPKVMECLTAINSGDYDEAVLTGAIGTGKTTIALFTTAYQLYLLSCLKNPHASFGLDPSSEIVFIFQSINEKLAKAVDYERFKAMLEKSSYFQEHFPFDKDLLSELKFPRRIIVKPVSGMETAAIGQNVYGGVIDELNFMAVVEDSKQSGPDGGTFDQATKLYNSIARRRKSRFMQGGVLPGVLCLVSSKRYPGQFTDKKEEERDRELELTGKSSIYIYDKRTWDIKPEGSFSGHWFKIFAGDEFRKPRILEEGEEVAEQDSHLAIDIPDEYRMEFETDIMNALRDIAGVSTLAKHPFIADREAVTACTRKKNIIFGREDVDFVHTRLSLFKEEFYKPELPRFIHGDLAVSGDSAGLALGTVTGFKLIDRGGHVEMLPDIWIDGILEIKPPKGGEILFYKVREVIYALKKMGLNIRWATFDSFQSVDFMQLLRQAGYLVGYQSVDTTEEPYKVMKNALYDGRMNLPYHPKFIKEAISLERDAKKGKIDHPPQGCHCKDTVVQCADLVGRTMGELVDDWHNGKVHNGVSWDIERKEEVYLPMLRPHITKYVTELVEVEVENGEVFRCTPDHPYLMDTGEYVAAEDLQPGDELQD